MKKMFTKGLFKTFVLAVALLLISLSSKAQLLTIGTGTVAQGTTGQTPYGTLYEDGRVQYLILKSELVAAGLTGPANFTSLGFDVTAVPTQALGGFTIKMAHTTATTITGYLTPSFVTCYTTTSTTPITGWNTYTFATNFAYNNIENIVVEVCFDNSSWSGNGTVNATTTAFASVYGTFMDGGTGCGAAPLSNTSASSNRPNMRIFAIAAGGGNQMLPPIAGFYPSVATPTIVPGMDTVYLGSPQKLVSTSTNAGRSFWDLPDEVVLNPGYSRQNVGFTSQTYIDTAKYSQSFNYTFNRTGFWPVRLLAVNAFRRDSLRDSTIRYIYVDTPGTPTVTNFFTARRKIGFAEYAPFVDLTDKGPNQWYWWFYRSGDSSSCNKCNNPPFFPNFFSNPYAQNPLFFGGDPGKWSVCLQTWNARGWDTTCYADYLEVLNSYSVCSGTGSSVVTDEEGFLFGAGGPGFSYTRGGIGACQGILIKPCADSIILWIERLKTLPSDSMVFHNGSNASAPVLATIGGNGLGNVPASVRVNGVRAGQQVFVRYKLGTQAVPVPYDSAGFTIRWEIKPPTYPKPTARMNIPDTIYSLQPIQFQSLSTGTNVSYTWDTDGDFVYDSSTANPTRTFLVNTTQYRTLCHVAFNCVGSDTVCKSVLFMPVVSNPIARFDADKLNGFNTDTFRLTDRSLNGPNSWRWTFTPAAQYLLGTNPTSRNPVVRLTLRTKYTVKLVVTNAFGKDSVTKIDYINIGAYDEPQCLQDISLSDGSIGISRVILEGGIDTVFTTNATSPCYQFIQGNQSASLYRGQGVNLTLVRPVGTAVSPIDRRVWIDLNMDGMFGSDELVLTENGSLGLSKTEKILVKTDQRLGSTRMRVGVTYSPTTLNPSVTFLGVFKDFVINYPMDTVRPVASLNGTQVMETEINKPFIDPGVTATDNIEGNVSSRYQRIGNVDITKVGPNYLKYIVTDYYGNVSDTLYRTVFVVLNQTGPSISLKGPSQQYVEVYNSFIDSGVVARDNQGNDISFNVLVEGIVDTTKLGQYSRLYSITDAFGKNATVNRLVVVGDTTRPVITPNFKPGQNFFEHQVQTSIDLEKVVTVTDNFWKGLKPTWISGPIDVNKVGSFFVIYQARDLSGNIANEIMVEIKVLDKVAPTIQLQGDNPLKWSVYRPFEDPGVSFNDNVWPKNTLTLTMIPAVIPVNSLGKITRLYIVSDPDGNRDTARREIEIIDNTAPFVKILGSNTINLDRWKEFIDPGVELVDDYNSDLEMRTRLVVENTLPLIPGSSNRWFGDIPGLFSVTYRVTDLSGNKSEDAVRYIKVNDVSGGAEDLIEFEKLLTVYPVPTSGKLYFRLVTQLESDAEIELNDIQGRKVISYSIDKNNLGENELDLSGVGSGVYLATLKTKSGTFTRRIVVQ